MRAFQFKFAGILTAVLILSAVGIAPADVLVPATRPSQPAVRQWIPQWIPRGFHAVRDVPYVLHARRSQMLDVYVPDVPTAPRPLLVWIHGGGWFSGDKALPPGMGTLLRGYTLASINYRLSSEAIFPAQIYDCKAAIRFLRAHAREFDIDPMRIGVWGESAGGQLASLLGTTNGRAEYEGLGASLGGSSAVQAVCDWFGPSDFVHNPEFHGFSVRAASLLFGTANSSSSTQEILAGEIFASPAEQVGHAPLVPFLIMHGDLDPYVPVQQSEVLYQKLREAGATVKLVLIPKGGHGNGWFRNRDDVAMVYNFFDRCFMSSKSRLLTPVQITPVQIAPVTHGVTTSSGLVANATRLVATTRPSN
jgi:acetyl esterase/lipase